MHTPSFLAIVVPGLGFVFLLLISAIAKCVHKYDSFNRYFVAAGFSQLSILVFRVTWIARKTVLQYRHKRQKKLAEAPATNMEDKFVIHVAEEFVKIVALVVCVAGLAQEGSASMPSYILVIGSTFAFNKLVCNLVTFSPIGYDQNYNKFTEALTKFEGRFHTSSDRVSVKSAGSSLQAIGTDSLYLQENEEKTKPQFKLNLFEPQNEASSAIYIPGSSNSIQAHPSAIDRLYSVSPKNTVYLDYEFNDTIGPDNCPDNCSDNLYSDISAEHTHGSSSSDSATSISEQNSNEIKSNHSFTSNKQCVPWWDWLLPRAKEPVPKVTGLKHERALIKKKLSTFTLNSDAGSAYEKLCMTSEIMSLKSSWSRASYGTLDLESQSPSERSLVANSLTYYEFARYANGHLDFWSSNLKGVIRCIDSAFIKFGVPLPQLPSFYLILYGTSVLMWQFTSTMMLALPFWAPHPISAVFIAYPILLIVRLFCANYLHSQCTRSYKFSVATELTVNVVLFSMAYFLFMFHGSR